MLDILKGFFQILWKNENSTYFIEEFYDNHFIIKYISLVSNPSMFVSVLLLHKYNLLLLTPSLIGPLRNI